MKIETVKLCDYGCGQEAKYQLKNGKWCCKENRQRCSSLKRKSKKPPKRENPGLCDYGCGQKAKYYFKTANTWCCSKNYQQCPEGKKLNPRTEEWKINQSNKSKGRTAWNKGLKYKIKDRKSCLKQSERMKINNPMKNPETVQKNLNIRIRNGTTGLGIPKPEYLNIKNSERMTLNNPMKNPETVQKNFRNHNREKTGPEKYLEKIFKKLNLIIEYIGDGKLFINGKCPDFIIPNTKKLIEAYDSSFLYGDEFRDEKWIEKRQNQLYGYDVLFIDFSFYGRAKNFVQLCNVVKDFYFK